jgi:arylsulfatase A
VNYKLPANAQLDRRRFLPQLRGRPGNPREWIYMHHDPRPGWDKDRFTLERFAGNRRFKLYDDGRLFDIPTAILEEKPIMLGADTKQSVAARVKLQQALDAHKPFPMFAPDDVPRENREFTAFHDYAFQDFNGCV